LESKLLYCSLSGKALRRGAPPEFWKHAGENSSPRNPAPSRNPGQKQTLLGAIFKKFSEKTIFKLKLNLSLNYLNFSSNFYSTKPSVGLPKLLRLSL
jgi:hypothetical protein